MTKKKLARIYDNNTGTSPDQQERGELAAATRRLDRAQERLAAVERREVGPKHSDRARWEREAADARREVAEAAERLSKLRGPGRPRTVAGEGDEDRATNAVVRLGQAHRDELDALVEDGVAGDRSKAVRWLIEQSAAKRAKRR
jgi:hypothetical protein